MRPLQYCPLTKNGEPDLEIFNNSCDFDRELFKFNGTLYDNLSDRGDDLIEDAMKKHMGAFYKEPLPYFKELKSKYDYHLEKKLEFEKRKAPKFIIDLEEDRIIDLYDKLKSKQFSSVTNPVQKKYRETHDKKKDEFYHSAEYHSLLLEIFNYNMHSFQAALASSSDVQDDLFDGVGYMIKGIDVAGAIIGSVT